MAVNVAAQITQRLHGDPGCILHSEF